MSLSQRYALALNLIIHMAHNRGYIDNHDLTRMAQVHPFLGIPKDFFSRCGVCGKFTNVTNGKPRQCITCRNTSLCYTNHRKFIRKNRNGQISACIGCAITCDICYILVKYPITSCQGCELSCENKHFCDPNWCYKEPCVETCVNCNLYVCRQCVVHCYECQASLCAHCGYVCNAHKVSLNTDE
jgi:hypothetical protein